MTGHDPSRYHEEYVGGRDLTVWASAGGRRLATATLRSLRWLAPRWVLVVTMGIGLSACILLAVGAAEIYDAVTESEGVAALDRPVLDWVEAHRTPLGEDLVTAFTRVGGERWMPVLATVVAISLALWWRSWTSVVLMAAAGGGGVLLTVVGKAVVDRTRPPVMDAVPPVEMSASFPSGHALNGLVLAGVVAYLVIRRLRTTAGRVITILAAGAFAAAMGLSRVYLGHHWLTDIMVAWAIGAAWLVAVVTAHRLYLTVRRQGRARRTA